MSFFFKKLFFIVGLLPFVITACTSKDSSKNSSSDSTIISFGSCSRQDIDNQRWDDVILYNPEVWIWLGDNIYGDTHDMTIMQAKYDLQKSNPGYQKLLKTKTKIIGTWDDHDYGVNDGGRHYSMKEESKALMLDFLDIDKENPVYTHEGVYQSYDYNFNNHLVKVMLLDTRNFRDTLYRDADTRAYLPNKTGDILGEDQWTWLENELINSTAEINIIGSGIQVIPEEHAYEKWANFPAARKRLYDLLVKYPDKKVLFLSGDRHIAEISKINLKGLSYPLYDFTSSGLTHSWRQVGTESNKNRVSNFIIGLNFGIIQIDWQPDGKNHITLKVIGEENKLLEELRFIL